MKKCESNVNVFHLNDMQIVHITSEWTFPQYVEQGLDLLAFIVEGKGEWQDGVGSDSIEAGDVVVSRSNLPNNTIVVTKEPIVMYYIEFSYTEVCCTDGVWNMNSSITPLQCKMNTRHLSVVYHCIKELYSMWCEEKVNNGKTQYLFSEIWDVLATRTAEDEQKLDAEQIIVNITEHIDEHYDEQFHVERMAQFSGMNIASFYQQFKEYTALSPIQYINKKRVDHARELLTTSDLSIHEIAKVVGYQDAYYFSRVFKKNVGISPRQYQKTLRRKIVVLNPAFVGDLVALGIPRESIILMLDEEQQQKHGVAVYASSFQFKRLQLEQPDMIIGTERDRLHYDNLAEIAPTWLVPYKQQNWRDQLVQLAAITQAKEVAVNWLRFYDLKAMTASKKIQKQLRNETILVARVFEKGVRIFGENRRKVGDLLYRDLKMKAPIATNDFHFKDLSHLEEINCFKADHILLLDDQQIYNSETNSLQGNIYQAPIKPWLYYSALGQEQALDEAVKLFSQRAIL